MIRSVFLSAAVIALLAEPAMAAPILLTCKVAGSGRMDIYMSNGSIDHSYRSYDLTEAYQIDLIKKSVTRTSAMGTNRNYDGNTKAVDIGAGYFTDIRASSDTLVVFCTDVKGRCEDVAASQGDAQATGRNSTTVIDLARLTISYSSHIEAKSISTGRYGFIVDDNYSGKCTKG